MKDPNGGVSSSKNYRGIAISSLIPKVLDNCVLLLFVNLLSNDAPQFGFQTGTSTVQCTWAVQETISHYLQGGSEVFCCLLDFSKAFDKVNFTQLFQKLVERSIPAIVLRLVLFIYLNQVCFIRWNSVESSSFKVRNGVRQGAILSPSLFCVYLDILFGQPVFLKIKICRYDSLCEAEWVSTAKHLGNHLSSTLCLSPYCPETKTDLLCKRAILFDRVHQVQQQFGQYDPQLVLHLVSIYSTALYGSPLWQLYSEEHQKLNRSWNTAVKLIWELPYATHTRLLEDLCPVSHLEHVLLSRYIGFIQNLCKSNKEILCLIFKSCLSNYRSVTGRNLLYMFKKFDIQTINQLFNVKAKLKDMRVYDLPDEENWKIKLIAEICLIRKNHLEIEFDQEHLNQILDLICCD